MRKQNSQRLKFRGIYSQTRFKFRGLLECSSSELTQEITRKSNRMNFGYALCREMQRSLLPPDFSRIVHSRRHIFSANKLHWIYIQGAQAKPTHFESSRCSVSVKNLFQNVRKTTRNYKQLR